MRKFIEKTFKVSLCMLTGIVLSANAQTYNIETIAGGATFGSADGNGVDATFRNPDGVSIDASGNLIIIDRTNHTIRKMTPSGDVTTIAGTVGSSGYAVGKPGKFNFPWQATIDQNGNIIVLEKAGHRVSNVAPDGTVSTLAGTGTAGFADGAVASAQFDDPMDAVIDSEGNVLIADRDNKRIRKITLGAGGSWATATVSTLAGDGTASSSIKQPLSLTIDGDDNLYVSDTYTIKKVTKLGVVTTIIGTGVKAYDEGTAGSPLTAKIGDVYGLNFDNDGNLILADATNHRIRKVTPGAGSDWTTATVSTIAGIGTAGSVDGLDNVASFNLPYDVVVGSTGIMYVADTGGHLIRKITPSTLPVELSYFKANKNTNNVSLQWQTLSEQNNSHFEVLKSIDGASFNSIGKVSGKGNSSTIVNYSFTDYNPFNGTNYYQLQQFDIDGESKKSLIQAVSFDLSKNNSLSAYVNAGQQNLELSITLEEKSDVLLKVIDIQGKILYENRRAMANGVSNITIPVSLKKGVYVVSLQSVKQNLSVKFIY